MLESGSDNTDDLDGVPDSFWNVVELCFTGAFLVEMLSKLTVLGWGEYTASLKNNFDALVTIVTVGVTAVVYIPNSISNSRVIRYVLALRLLRLLRLMNSFPQARPRIPTHTHAYPRVPVHTLRMRSSARARHALACEEESPCACHAACRCVSSRRRSSRWRRRRRSC